LRWLDIVTWDEATHSWDWRFESKMAKEVLVSFGTNRMEAAGPDATRFVISGTLDIHVEKLPGVPGFIGRRVRPQVEKFIVSLVEPRLRGIDEGLAKWLDAKSRTAPRAG